MELTKSIDPSQQRYEAAIRGCIEEIKLVNAAMDSMVATLQRLAEIKVPLEVGKIAATELHAITAEIANGLTRGNKSITRTLPAAMLEAERNIMKAVDNR